VLDLIDTHCHIHFPDYELDPEEVIANASQLGVTKLLCVGCTLEDSKLAIKMASKHENIWATIGLHPHEAKEYVRNNVKLADFHDLAASPRVVAIGEAGLDYHYNHSPREDQIKLLRFQLDIAVEHKLPLIFHVREAFEDFWQIFDEYKDIRGVVHSFSSTKQNVSEVLKRGLYVGINGIMTFTKNADQLAAAKAIPLNKLLLETDSPYLTPTPYRGTVNEPKRVVSVAEFLSDLRGESLEQLAHATTANAKNLFGI